MCDCGIFRSYSITFFQTPCFEVDFLARGQKSHEPFFHPTVPWVGLQGMIVVISNCGIYLLMFLLS